MIARIPLAALAGVTAYVGLGLLEWSTWRAYTGCTARRDCFSGHGPGRLTTNAVAAVAIGCSFYIARHSLEKLARLERFPLHHRVLFQTHS